MLSNPDAPLIAPTLALAAEGTAPQATWTRAKTEAAVAPVTLEALYADHARAIHRFLWDLLGDPAAAADATQETFVRAFQRLHTLEARDRPAPWLFGIARHVSLEVIRARRRRRQVLEEDPPEAWEERPPDGAQRSPEEDVISREALALVEGALARLPEGRRAALLLRLDHDMSYEDIARAMVWSVAKAKVEVHRARQVLRAELSKHEEEKGGGR